ncbi:YibE/F family protein [Butyrivibrio sp. FCS014]|uniref:YibE/F family protein n=1 Tax=Butyrivibrio sp. FCS014 TaxID=1408304 RepID=UPI0004635876|nr:YibE/F family protein [Butyrivibrio sp. FCS014]
MLNKSFDKKRIIINTLVVIVFSLVMIGVLFLVNRDRPRYTTTSDTGVEYENAKVLAVTEDNSVIDEKTEGVLKGSMELKVKILTGRYKGDVCFVTNYFSSLYNVVVKEGDTVCVRIDTTGENVYSCSVYNYNRVPLLIGLVLVFFLSLAIIGGVQGIKAFVGLLYTIICMFGILLPLTIKGVPAIPLTCAIILVTSAVCFYLIGGISKKTVAAALGCMSGVLIAALLGQIAANIGGITTFQMDEAEALLLLKSTSNLKMRGLFTSGILIAAMGAVMDITMSISSALEEVHIADPSKDVKGLIKSGLNIGRDAMGTMANTLVLAYVGSALNMCVLIYSYGVGWRQLLCTDFVAIEIIRAVAGSVGIICAVPCVSAFAALLYTSKKS